MAYKINDECVNCGSCVPDCPFEAIVENDGKYSITAEKCSDCGACVASCPTEAIVQA